MKRKKIVINLLDEETNPKKAIKTKPIWIFVIIIFASMGVGSYFYFQAEVNKELQMNQYLLMQIANIPPDITINPNRIDYNDVLRHKDSNYQNIISERTLTAKLFEDIEKTVPADVHLSEIDIKEKTISIRGNSINYKQMSSLLSGLQNIPYFSKIAVDSKMNNENAQLEFVFEIKREEQ